MSEELDKIRAELERNLKMGNFDCDVKGAREGARICLDLLAEYERKLVKIEGVEGAHDMLRANDCASVACASESPRTLEVGVWDHDETGRATISICPELNDGCSGEVNAEQLERHIAQCIAALHILKGK